MSVTINESSIIAELRVREVPLVHFYLRGQKHTREESNGIYQLKDILLVSTICIVSLF